MQKLINRRSVITGLALGGIGTFALLSSSSNATATISMGNFDVSGNTVTTDSGTIQAVSASVSGSWSYAINHGQPQSWRVTLSVGRDSEWAKVGKASGSASYYRYSDSYSIEDSITETRLYASGNFAVEERGESKSIDLPLQVCFELLGTNQRVLASAEIIDTATVTVKRKAFDASLYGEVGGSGTVQIKTESD